MQALLSSFRACRVVAFDADDTLWDNQMHYRKAESDWASVLAPFGSREELSAALYEIETANMAELGYGTKAFFMSLIQTALKVGGDRLTAAQTGRILDIARELLRNPATPLPGVEETLSKICRSARYKTVLLTKGDPLEQELKIERSGLGKYFDFIDIVSAKTVREYNAIFSKYGISPSEFLMVGNSFKSDIAPVLELGGYAVHIPYHLLWEHEVMEEYEHPNLLKITTFSLLQDILP